MIPTPRTSLGQRVLFITLGLVVVGWWFYLHVSGLTDAPANYLFNALYGVPYLLAALYAYRRAWQWSRTVRSPDIGALVFFGTTCLFYGLAQGLWAYYNLALGEDVPDLSIADLFFLGSSVSLVISLLLFALHVRAKQTHSRLTNVVFGVTLLLVVAGCSYTLWRWFFLSDTGFFTIDGFYSFISSFTLLLILINLYRNHHARLRWFFLALFGMGASSVIADVVFAVRNRAGTYFNGDISDGFYAIAAMLAFFAVLRHLPADLKEGEVSDEELVQGFARSLRPQLLVPVALVAAVLVLSIQHVESVYETQLEETQVRLQLRSAEALSVFEQSALAAEDRALSLKAFMESRDDVTPESFAMFESTLRRGNPYVSLGFVGIDDRIQYYSEDTEDTLTIGFPYTSLASRAVVLDKAQETRSTAISEPVIGIASKRPVIVSALPAFRHGEYVGQALSLISLRDVLLEAQVVFDVDPVDVYISTDKAYVSPDGSEIFDHTGRRVRTPDGQVEADISYVFPDETLVSGSSERVIATIPWKFTFVATPETIQSIYIDTLILFLAINLVSLLFSLSLYSILTQQSSLRAQLAERTSSLRHTVMDLQRYKFFLDNIAESVTVTDPQNRVLYANEATAVFTGVPLSDLLHTSGERLFVADTVPVDEAEDAFKAQGYWRGEAQMRHADGTIRDVLMSVRPLHEDRKLVGFVSFVSDITDRKAIERAKTQFVSLVSHQLRAPMTQLRWLTDTLLATKRLPASTRRIIQDINVIVGRENHFIKDLLNVSRIERGVLRIETENVGVGDVIKDVLEPLRPLAEERGVTLHVGRIPRTARVLADRVKLTEALRNLVDNAVKYTTEKTPVSIDAVRNGDTWEIRIADHGEGISEDLLPTLYEIKTTVTSAEHGGSSSSGLGLYLTKKFVDAMHGTIRLQTGPLGTTFFVQVPVAHPKRAPKS